MRAGANDSSLGQPSEPLGSVSLSPVYCFPAFIAFAIRFCGDFELDLATALLLRLPRSRCPLGPRPFPTLHPSMSHKNALSILLFLIALSPCSKLVAEIFLTRRNYPSGEYPSAVVVKDLNNDGIPDIVSANSNDANLSVFLGRRNGTFAPAMNFSVGAGAVELASADLNGDGKADLAVTDGIKSVYVVLGNGDGTFGSPTRYTLHTSTIGVEVADLNADGKLDLAVANFGPPNNSRGEIAILLGNGDGSFAVPAYYELGHNAVRLTAVELNGDAALDLAVAVEHFSSQVNSLAVLLGNGDGTFQMATT